LHPPTARIRCAPRRALSWPALLLSWALAWLVLLPFAQAADIAPASENVHVVNAEAPEHPGSRPGGDEAVRPGWEAPSETDVAAIEPLPDRESDPTTVTPAARRHGQPVRRIALASGGDSRFRPRGCLPPHGHAPPRA